MEHRIALICCCLGLLSWLSSCDALRILVAFPISSKSHNILGQGIVNNLIDAGHEVPNIVMRAETFKLKNLIGKSNIADSIGFMLFIGEFNRIFLEFEPVNNFLSDPKERFDLAILEWFFSETVAGIPALFQCPFIWIASTEVHGHILRVIDEVPNPAYSADLFSTNTPPFTFWQRAVELTTACWRHFVVNFIIVPFEKSLYNRIYPTIAVKRGVSIPSYEEATHNASMVLVNSHPSFGTPFKLPQNVKYIGGYHIDRHIKPLPKDLQKLMDESKHGVIYFSMGSNLQSKDMSTGMKESLIKMFGLLKEDVIWKFEDDMDHVAPNVHLLKWAPQPSILAHPKTKLFITHGGQLSTTEAIHFGVPLVGVPVFGDQYVNMKTVTKKGYGVMVKISEDFTDDLRAAVDIVLENPEYMKKAKYLSSVYHDRMATPGDELVYWAEHVVRTKGAPHLRSPASMLAWYQKMYLDLAAVLILIMICVKVAWNTWMSRINKKQKRN